MIGPTPRQGGFDYTFPPLKEDSLHGYATQAHYRIVNETGSIQEGLVTLSSLFA